MSITSAQVFVRTDRLDRLLKAVEGYLARWAKVARGDWPDVPFLGTDASRTTLVLPPLEGWCCLLDPDPGAADEQLVRELSGALSTSAVGLVLRGRELVWSCVAYEDGKLVSEEREPPEAFGSFGPDPSEGTCRMPMYPDATFEATRALLAAGVPRGYWLLTQADLGSGGAAADDAVWIDEISAHPERRRPVERFPRVPRTPRHELGRIPFRPDREDADADLRPVIVETRTLFGTPDHQAITNLLEIERADRNRIAEFRRETRPGGRARSEPSVHFEYSLTGGAEDELVRMLDLRRPDYFRSRPPKCDFLKRALDLACAEYPAWKDVRSSGLGVCFRYGDSGPEHAVDLEGLYVEYMEGRLAARGPEDALGTFLGDADAGLQRTVGRAELDSVRDLMVPLLVDAGEAARLAGDGVPSMPLGHGVETVIACKVGDGTALIVSEDLERWGLGVGGALEIARANLLRREEAGGRGPLPVQIAPGRKALALLSGSHPATHLLMPGLPAILGGLVGSDEILCTIPDQDSFFAVDASDAAAATALRAFARERFLVAEKPLTADLFRVKGDAVFEA